MEKPGVLIIEGTAAANGEGVTLVLVFEQLERTRSAALQIADSMEILLGYSPTTAEMRREWRQLRRK